MDLVRAGKMTEQEARAWFEAIRWPHGVTCPHCGCLEVTRLAGQKHRAGLIQCNGCRNQFTVTLGTVMEDSHIPLQKWVLGFHLMCSSKKGISALQLKRNLGLGSYKTAWHMAHRIRHAMNEWAMLPSMEGRVEVDETYIGGKPRKPRGGKPKVRESYKKRKVAVVALIERDGKMRARPVANVTTANLRKVIKQTVRPEAILNTDENPAYRKIGVEYAGHERVNHLEGEYARGEAHVNHCESFFALLKRGVHGVFHHVSKQHLHRYCDEFAFRWEHRKVDDGERTAAAVRLAEGKRLMYHSKPQPTPMPSGS